MCFQYFELVRLVPGVAWLFRSYVCHAFCFWISWIFQCPRGALYANCDGSHPFPCLGSQLVALKGEDRKIVCIPVVVVASVFASTINMYHVVSPFPPSDKIGITSVQRG